MQQPPCVICGAPRECQEALVCGKPSCTVTWYYRVGRIKQGRQYRTLIEIEPEYALLTWRIAKESEMYAWLIFKHRVFERTTISMFRWMLQQALQKERDGTAQQVSFPTARQRGVARSTAKLRKKKLLSYCRICGTVMKIPTRRGQLPFTCSPECHRIDKREYERERTLRKRMNIVQPPPAHWKKREFSANCISCGVPMHWIQRGPGQPRRAICSNCRDSQGLISEKLRKLLKGL